MTVNTPVVQSIIGAILQRPLIDTMPLPDGLQLQILPRMTDLPRCQKHHFAAFVLEPPVLVVWDDEPNLVILRAEKLEQSIIKLIWRSESEEDEDEEKGHNMVEGVSPGDLEDALAAERRPIRTTSALMVAIALGLAISCLGLGWRWLAFEVATDGDFVRIALVAAAPVTFFISIVSPLPFLDMWGFENINGCSSSTSSSSPTCSRSLVQSQTSPQTPSTTLARRPVD